MVAIRLQGPEIEFEAPALIEGFPGIGLVGKIATDHLIEQFDMRYYASVHCEGLPEIGTYRAGERTVRPPVRVYASAERDLLALQSDVPVAAEAVRDVAECVTGWIERHDALPIYLSGLPAEKDDVPDLYGVATGGATEILETHGIEPPAEDGAVSGPTGALLNRAAANEYDSLGLIVQSSPQFPDPEAARVLVEGGIAPISGHDVDVSDLVDHAEEIRTQREKLARRMQTIDEEESSQARPMQMFQ